MTSLRMYLTVSNCQQQVSVHLHYLPARLKPLQYLLLLLVILVIVYKGSPVNVESLYKCLWFYLTFTSLSIILWITVAPTGLQLKMRENGAGISSFISQCINKYAVILNK